MSYIFNNQITYKDSPNLDAFSRLRVSQNTNILDIKHTYDKNPLLVDERISGGTSTFDKENARVRMTTVSNGDFVVRQTKSRSIYQPGKSQLFEASFGNLLPNKDVVKRVGAFTSSGETPFDSYFDGYFLEYDGVNDIISFQIWKSGTTIFSADSTTWNNTEFDPLNIDWSQTQLMLVDYQWLGVGRMRFGMVFDGIVYYFKEHNSTNSEDSVYMSSPNQPIRYEIRQYGGITDYFDMICSGVSTEGPLSNGLSQLTTIIQSGETTLSTSNTKYAFIGYRLKEGYASVNSYIDKFIVSNTSNHKYFATIEYNPVISSAVWTDIPNTPFQYSLGTGQTVSSSDLTITNIFGDGQVVTEASIDISDNIIKPGVNLRGVSDEMWLCITPYSNTAKFRGSINLRYYL
jgi:hypothetical protein